MKITLYGKSCSKSLFLKQEPGFHWDVPGTWSGCNEFINRWFQLHDFVFKTVEFLPISIPLFKHDLNLRRYLPFSKERAGFDLKIGSPSKRRGWINHKASMVSWWLYRFEVCYIGASRYESRLSSRLVTLAMKKRSDLQDSGLVRESMTRTQGLCKWPPTIGDHSLGHSLNHRDLRSWFTHLNRRVFWGWFRGWSQNSWKNITPAVCEDQLEIFFLKKIRVPFASQGPLGVKWDPRFRSIFVAAMHEKRYALLFSERYFVHFVLTNPYNYRDWWFGRFLPLPAGFQDSIHLPVWN